MGTAGRGSTVAVRGDTVVGQMAAGWVGMAGRLDRKDGNLVHVAVGRGRALGAGGDHAEEKRAEGGTIRNG